MAGDPDIAALNRTMKEVNHNLSKIAKVLIALNENYVEINRMEHDIVDVDNVGIRD